MWLIFTAFCAGTSFSIHGFSDSQTGLMKESFEGLFSCRPLFLTCDWWMKMMTAKQGFGIQTMVNYVLSFQIVRGFYRTFSLALIGICSLASHVAQAGLIESFEAPGVTQSSVSNTEVVTFNGLTPQYASGYTTSEMFTFPNLTVNYSGDFFILPPGQYGGAPQPGNVAKDTEYLGVHSGEAVTMTFSTPQAYFGLWFSAADKLNDLAFYSGNKLIASITGTGPVLGVLPSSYKGNPTQEFKGSNAGEKYVFINFSAQTSADKFDKIVLSNASGGTIFESDNHTFSADIPIAIPGTSVVSEPTSVALLGFGAMCLLVNAYRRRQLQVPTIDAA